MLWRLLCSVLPLAVVHTASNSTDSCGVYSRHLVQSDPDARCLDGSPASYLYKKGFESGVDKWMIFFQGGGWCYDLRMCFRRSQSRLGSSAIEVDDACENALRLGGYLPGASNGIDRVSYNFNLAFVNYCDGGSFSGDAQDDYNGTTLYFKGAKIRRAVVTDLMTRFGMHKATDIVISGSSAGGLAVYLGLDEMRDQIHSYNRRIRVGGVAEAGYFLDYVSPIPPRPLDIAGQPPRFGAKAVGNPPKFYFEQYDEKDNVVSYPKSMRSLFHFMNISIGASPACLRQHPAAPSDCMFAQHLLPTMKSPLLVIQSKFDSWQLQHVLGLQATHESYISDINTAGHMIESQIAALTQQKKNVVVYLDSCTHHEFTHGEYFTTVRDAAMLSPADVFDAWITRYFVSRHGKTSLRQQPHFSWKENLVFRQTQPYPCLNCCNSSHARSKSR